jgi:DNA polymerase I-like protein with 3'-5' exonuclease and polymerase domains
MAAKSFVEYAKQTYGVVVTPDESATIRYHFFELYPELNVYYDWVRTSLKNDSCITSIMRREYQLNPHVLHNQYERENIIRAAINFPIQSAGSDYVISGLIEVMNDPELKDCVRLGATVHDSIIGLVKKDEKFYYNLAKIKSIMEHPKLAQQMLTTKIDMPIVVDVEIGPLGKGISIEEYMEKELEEAKGF